ncbi:XRE family transcriptional regulator [Crenobacter cavernae]|uniref:XRE family transcriptional regulator n=2 Tax=Crenobacter cavernae TaxID=2290923 RepID=A0ABY0FCH6_9NEIS|nr:XRE family transcriptional regulator [Crenobacter cavernae]
MPVLPDFESAEFPPALKAMRKQLRLSRTALAQQVQLSTAAIQRYEAQDGSHIKPSREAYERLCAALSGLLAESPAEPVRAPAAPAPAPQAVAAPAPAAVPDVLLSEATLEQLIARAKMLGAKKVTVEF